MALLDAPSMRPPSIVGVNVGLSPGYLPPIMLSFIRLALGLSCVASTDDGWAVIHRDGSFRVFDMQGAIEWVEACVPRNLYESLRLGSQVSRCAGLSEVSRLPAHTYSVHGSILAAT